MNDRIEPQAGEVWQHYAGGLYRVVAVAIEVDTGRDMVVYTSLVDGRVWCRPMARWMSCVTTQERATARRFVLVDDGGSPVEGDNAGVDQSSPNS